MLLLNFGLDLFLQKASLSSGIPSFPSSPTPDGQCLEVNDNDWLQDDPLQWWSDTKEAACSAGVLHMSFEWPTVKGGVANARHCLFWGKNFRCFLIFINFALKCLFSQFFLLAVQICLQGLARSRIISQHLLSTWRKLHVYVFKSICFPPCFHLVYVLLSQHWRFFPTLLSELAWLNLRLFAEAGDRFHPGGFPGDVQVHRHRRGRKFFGIKEVFNGFWAVCIGSLTCTLPYFAYLLFVFTFFGGSLGLGLQ